MPTIDELTYAYQWDHTGKEQEVSWEGVTMWKPEDGLLWLVCNPDLPEVRSWLEHESGITPQIATLMLNDDNHPRIVRGGADGFLIVMRGMNYDRQHRDAQMIPIKVWVDRNRVIALRNARVLAFRDIRTEMLEPGSAPTSSLDLLHHMISRIIYRMERLITSLIHDADDLEHRILSVRAEMVLVKNLHGELVRLRKRIIVVRSQLVPLEELSSSFLRQRSKWFDARHKRMIAEEFGRLHTYLESLSMLRERSSLLEDEIHALEANYMNRNIYILTFLTGVFVPMNLIPSMLGSNIGGIYGATDPDAFEYLMALELLIFCVGSLLFIRHVRKITSHAPSLPHHEEEPVSKPGSQEASDAR